jgi:hypothetical protein
MLLIGGPQFLAHLYFAISTRQNETPRIEAMRNLAGNSSSQVRHESVKLLFGPDADADLVIDARPAFGDALAKAEVARFASLPTGETVLLARFDRYAGAERAWFLYLQYTGLNRLQGKGNSQSGYAVTRPTGDRAYALHMSSMLGVWTAPNDAMIRQRMLAGGFEIPHRAPLGVPPSNSPANEPPAAGEGTAPNRQTTGADTASAEAKPRLAADHPTSVKPGAFGIVPVAGGLAAYLLLVALYFFKGAAWAGSSPARPGAAPSSASELVARLEAINHLDVPFRIEHGEANNQLIVTWRYADAKWVDLARAHGTRHAHRIKLALDESGHTVRATDFAASYDWSAGRGGASAAWRAMTGITFFHYEHQRVFGLQLDEQGRFKPELAYSYTFNLQEMKAPLIETVTRAGWNWRPVAWQGPKWLRWLTE